MLSNALKHTFFGYGMSFLVPTLDFWFSNVPFNANIQQADWRACSAKKYWAKWKSCAGPVFSGTSELWIWKTRSWFRASDERELRGNLRWRDCWLPVWAIGRAGVTKDLSPARYCSCSREVDGRWWYPHCSTWWSAANSGPICRGMTMYPTTGVR